jgi:hypothetical protein
MMLFLFYTLIFWLAVAGFTFMLWVSIQPGNWAEKWQNRLRKWDLDGNEFLYRIMGGCQVCFSHAIAQVSFLFYVAFFLSLDIWAPGIIGSIIWYIVYISVCTNINLFFITKLYK